MKSQITVSGGPASPSTCATGVIWKSPARIAGHESTRTTQLYNRVHEELSLDEIERIHI